LKTRCGTPYYLAPKIVVGKPYNPLAVDIWSCGIIFYSMVAGSMPFDGDNDAEIF